MLKGVRRLVIKVGTSVLTTSNNRLDTSYIEELVEDISALRKRGLELALVTSGAIAAGMKILNLNRRPKPLADVQAAAAVGQSNLMRTYERLFKERGYVVGQVLLTKDVFNSPLLSSNARRTLKSLFSFGVIPIINENDTVAVDEIRFGDNDTLSAMVAKSVSADLLIILSDVDGFYVNGKICSEVNAITNDLMAEARGSNSEKSVGGMVTKLEAAAIVTKEGKPVIIANGRTEKVLTKLLSGEEIGTVFMPAGGGLSTAKKLTGKRKKI